MCAVSIEERLMWSLRLGESNVRLCNCELPCPFTSSAEVLVLVRYIDDCVFCERNMDAKFEGLIEHHKGCFKNSSGKQFLTITFW